MLPIGQRGVSHLLPPQPAEHWHVRLPWTPTHLPWRLQPSSQSAIWQRAPDQPGSHLQWPGLTHVPWPQPAEHTGFSHSSPLCPSTHTHTGLVGAADRPAPGGGRAQWPWPEHAVAPQ